MLFPRLFVIVFLCLIGGTRAQQPASISERFPVPAGFKRVQLPDNHFGSWLRQLPLQKEGTAVRDYRGKIFKIAQDSTVAAVVRLPVQVHRLEQCMDVLMRLWASYLQDQNRLDALTFPLADGLHFSWRQYREGYRARFRGLHNQLFLQQAPDSSEAALEHYLKLQFAESGSHTFYHYLPAQSRGAMQPGDFIVRRQRKGHAVMLVDMAGNNSGKMLVLVGQGDTPACGFYILKNPATGRAWMEVDSNLEFLPLPIRKKMYWSGLRRFPAITQ